MTQDLTLYPLYKEPPDQQLHKTTTTTGQVQQQLNGGSNYQTHLYFAKATRELFDQGVSLTPWFDLVTREKFSQSKELTIKC